MDTLTTTTAAVVDYDGLWRALVNGQLTSGWWSTAERARQHVVTLTPAPCEEVVATPELRALLVQAEEARRALLAQEEKARLALLAQEAKQREERYERRLRQPAERRKRAAREAQLQKRREALAALGADSLAGGRYAKVYESTALSLLGCAAEVLREHAPSTLVTNPHYRSGPKARLYDPRDLLAARDSIRQWAKQRSGQRPAQNPAEPITSSLQ